MKAEQGDAKAQFELADSYRYDRKSGEAADMAEYAKWMRRSAQQGYDRAQASIGNACVTGKVAETEEGEGLKWLEKSADQDNIEAMAYLCYYYIKHDNSNDYQKIREWIGRAENVPDAQLSPFYMDIETLKNRLD